MEDTVKKNQLLDKYKHITIDDKSIEVLMESSSSSVITYVKPGLIEKLKVVFVEKQYKNHQYFVTHQRRWSDGNASQWLMQQMEAKQTEKKQRDINANYRNS